jgi:hypothetical protein
MSKKGFYLQKLRVVGGAVNPAEVSFGSGLNVISGSSNTGKSYICSCIDFMLGASTPPEPIPESNDYSEILLEIKTYEGHTYTLKRPIKQKSDAILYECDIENVEKTIGKKLKATHNPSNLNNISAFLLSLSDLNGKKVLKKESELRNFSFRDVIKLLLIDEEKIISKESPIFSGQYTLKTSEKSAFNLLLTGKDAKVEQEIKDTKTAQAKIKAKIETLEKLALFLNKKIEENRFESGKIDEISGSLDKKIDGLSELLDKNSKLIEEKMVERKDTWEKRQKVISRKIQLEKLLSRFELLEKHYISDLERLEFIAEGHHYLSQLVTVPCPICGRNFEKYEEITSRDSKGISLIYSCNKECEKIRIHMKDLQDTVLQMRIELKDIEKQDAQYEEIYRQCEKELNDNLNPANTIAKNELKVCIEEKESTIRYQLNKKYLEELEKEILLLEQQNSDMKTINNTQNFILEEDSIYELCNEIEELIENWNYIKPATVEFNLDKYDIEVSNKLRSSNGKGIRAILYSAFTIALMKHSTKANLQHPGFVVIDSPLTTYRKNDNTNEDVSPDVQQSFFKNLSLIGEDQQVIILENKEPKREIKHDINYIHFSGREGAGRKGFFP